MEIGSDDDYKRMLINRNKRLYNNILKQLQIGRENGVVSKKEVEQYKSNYNEIVIESAKKEYFKNKNTMRGAAHHNE